ncbi:hypothetical protein ES332_A11G159100v1 [Gossypium tomentosum]|uniref:Uncharacterized protein n=1 Tax=Gossypium tomentosum TaxID=34277 RepID=A0A5D2NA08_GOSTO|nr:hypothetical protein ES332_A11G159100v1 [Gossypium tomentosum]
MNSLPRSVNTNTISRGLRHKLTISWVRSNRSTRPTWPRSHLTIRTTQRLVIKLKTHSISSTIKLTPITKRIWANIITLSISILNKWIPCMWPTWDTTIHSIIRPQIRPPNLTVSPPILTKDIFTYSIIISPKPARRKTTPSCYRCIV